MDSRIAQLIRPFHGGHGFFVASSGFVQLLPLVSAPIVAQLYSPSDFGIYAIFFALATILTSISSLALHTAILLEPDARDSFHATILAIGITLAFSLAVLLLVLVVPDWMQEFALGADVLPFLIWLPLTVVLAGSFRCLYNWAVSAELFELLARNKLALGLSTMVLQIAIGLTESGPIGFVLANLLGLCLALALIVRPFLRRSRAANDRPSFRAASLVFAKHAVLAMWTVPSTVVNTMSKFLPDLLINGLFGVTQLGQYSLANRLVNFPLAFVATSAQDIFRQQCVSEFDATGRCVRSFRRFFLIMAVLSLFLVVPVILLVPFVLPIIFGQQWNEAGYLIQATGLLIVARFISSPLSFVWIVRGQHRQNFFWQLGLMSISLGAFFGPQWLNPDISLYLTLWVFSSAVGVWYVLAIIISYHFAHSSTHPMQVRPPS